MKIACVGGGPAGLYFAVVAKLRDPGREVVVLERNPPGTTYGWGVVYWDSLRNALHRVDPTSAREITARSVTWTGQRLRIGERIVHLGGYGYSIERRQLLDVLQARAHELGVQMRFEETVDEAADVDADVIVAADGHTSALRSDGQRSAHRYAPVPTPTSGWARPRSSRTSPSVANARTPGGCGTTVISSRRAPAPLSSNARSRRGESSAWTIWIAGNLANWRDGANNRYVERIDYNNETEARTITVSPHSASAGGPQAGTVWLYSRIGADQVHVQPSGKKPFILGRCGS